MAYQTDEFPKAQPWGIDPVAFAGAFFDLEVRLSTVPPDHREALAREYAEDWLENRQDDLRLSARTLRAANGLPPLMSIAA